MAPSIKKEDVAYLRILIQEHHMLFRELYPDASIIPKMHYSIHVPDDISGMILYSNKLLIRFI